ncbi:MAG: hypothetical protein DHS20C16_33300 [Phycisphaerae bacterium]|nr:MAG: hypothetical protein DHS20C16_33300 [Phycisphaerae bacterium]
MQSGWMTIQLLASQVLAHAKVTELTTGGWAMMLGSIAMVTALSVFCITRIFSENKPSEHHHVPLDIDTDDVKLP